MTAPELPSARAIMAQAIRLATSRSATERDLAQARTLVLVARELREGSMPRRGQLAAEADVATHLGVPLASGGIVRSGPAIIGDLGPETLVDRSGEPVSAPFFDAARAQFGETCGGDPAYLAPPEGDEPSLAGPDVTAVLPAEPGVTTTVTDFDRLREVDLSGVRQQFRAGEVPHAPQGAEPAAGRLPGEGTRARCRFCGHGIVYARQNRERQDPVWHHSVTQQRVCPVGVGPDSGHTFATPE